MRRALLAVLVALPLSGCFALVSGVTVVVTDEPGGPPMEGVLVTMSSNSIFAKDAKGTTDAHGHASFAATSGAIFRANVPGRAPESVPIGSAADGYVHLPLYHARIVRVLDGDLSGGDATTHATGVVDRWTPREVAWGNTTEARTGYGERVERVNATLRWNNSLTAAGDLAIGVSSTSDRAEFWSDDSSAQIAPGAYEESLHLTFADLSKANWRPATHAYVGAGAGKAWAAPTSLHYTITVEATFGPRHVSGSAQVLGAVLALATTALLLAGRRPRSS